MCFIIVFKFSTNSALHYFLYLVWTVLTFLPFDCQFGCGLRLLMTYVGISGFLLTFPHFTSQSATQYHLKQEGKVACWL